MSFPVGIGVLGIRMTNSNTSHESFITFGLNMGVSPDLENIGVAIHSFLLDIMQDVDGAITADQMTLTQNVTGGGTGTLVIPLEDPVSGGAAGDPVAPAISFVYQKQTELLGRGSKGRFYLPGPTANHVRSDGSVSPTFLTDQRNHASSALDALMTAGDGTLRMLLLHRNSSDYQEVVRLVPETFVGTQRRRMPRAA